MSCVEGAVVAQVPGPNQYWEHIKSKDRAYFIGRDPDGRLVWQCEGDCIEVGNLDWSGWRHLPGCTGWDWEPDQVEEYPQYWTSPAVGSTAAFVKRVSQTECVTVMPSGTYGPSLSWEHSFPESRTRLTEQEALALLDKPDKRAEVAQNTIERIKRFDPASVPVQKRAEQWPRFFINPDPDLKWYIRAENGIDAPLVYLEDGRTDTCKAEWTDIICYLGSGTWVDVTEAEAIARIAVDKAPAEVWPKYYVCNINSPGYYRCDSEYEVWHIEPNATEKQHAPASTLRNKAIWTEVTEAEAKDRVTKAAEPAISVEFVPVAPDMDWVVQDRVPARIDVDEFRWASWNVACGHQPVHERNIAFGQMHGYVDPADSDTLHLRCRRKDLPEIAPEMEWVDITDRDQLLRRDIDQVYRCVDTFGYPIGWEFVRVPGLTLNKASSDLSAARCRRKDLPVVEPEVDWVELPPIPAPIEETFPQWYILKDDEKRSWVPDWTVKRTGEETAIRYARDEAGELYATNEPWTGAPDCWERCTAMEAIVRMCTSQFPRVPSEHRRVPVKLWVTYRLNDEGGDWPVRATQADQTCQNWKEIKFDGNGAFIEVDQ